MRGEKAHFENRTLKKIFGSKREEITGGDNKI
jgi:hypothetical protein